MNHRLIIIVITLILIIIIVKGSKVFQILIKEKIVLKKQNQ